MSSTASFGEWSLPTVSSGVVYGPCIGSSLSALSATIPHSRTVVPPTGACPVNEPPSPSTLASNASDTCAHPVFASWGHGLEESDVAYYSYYDAPVDQP